MTLRYMGVPDRCPHGEYEDRQCDKCEIERLQAFRDAVYENIVENAGGQFPYAYIWQARWDGIKAAEKTHATPIDT